MNTVLFINATIGFSQNLFLDVNMLHKATLKNSIKNKKVVDYKYTIYYIFTFVDNLRN